MAQLVDNIQPYNDWGDYVPEDDEEDVTGFTEGVDGYAVRGGYPGPPCYPVTVGEVIQGGGKSYRIEHKLGHGAFSTIWLAFEVETNTSVALKIHRTHTRAGHAESQIHITDKNVMIGLIPGALDQGPTPSERYKQVGRPQKFPLPTCDFVWRPGDLVAPIEWPSSIVGKTAFLGDFGLMKRADSPVTDDYLPPLTCCPPELLHKGFEPTYASDMWGFMCIFHTLMTNYTPFSGWSDSGPLGFMTHELGPLPQEWEGLYQSPWHYPDAERDKWYDQSRSPRVSFFERFLDRCRKELVGSRERELIVEVMYKGFRFQPAERPTAQQLLEDPSFRELLSIHGIE
ncbi:hypothetical protein VSDG_03562 [Cytospora chrysosperma]|uniref:Protein kinase domain-containing protein n=1 Tax=Cytospora chrysosperma TaxID=252740 RepID=A0A423WA33_CYTCH|nr:hypothetical protein VSDG_03562 [Valsa sordida]